MRKVKRDEKLVLVRETVIGLKPEALEGVNGGAAAAGDSLIKKCFFGSVVKICVL